jgi:D-galactarolactone isomerase
MVAVAALGLAHARAIVVVEPDVADAELRRLDAAGARGVRFQMWPGGHLPWEALEPVARRVTPLGWHLQLQLNGRLLADREALLRRLPCPVVIDHVARFTPPVPPEHESFRALLRLLGSGRCWLKLSGPYGSSLRPDWSDVAPLARAAADAAPERMLWASDWPHPSEAVPPDDARLLDVLLDWVPDEGRRRRTLVDNPAALYGFAP